MATANPTAALHRIVLVRLRYHQATKDYVERRTSEGKSKREIIRCLNPPGRSVYDAVSGRTTAFA